MSALPLILRFAAVALGLLVAQWSSDSVGFRSEWSFVFTVLLLGILATVLRPVLILLMLPLVILTLGLGLWVVNALIVMLASALVPGFFLAGWGAAFWTALWISLFSVGAFVLAGKQDPKFRRIIVRQRGFRPDARREERKDDDDVIDI